MSYESMGDIPIWMRGQYVTGGGMYAPGGLTIGPTFGPGKPGMPSGPGGCTEVTGGGSEVCIHPPTTETGPERTPWQQREMTPEEYDLQDSGCVPTNRRCGGSPRMPSRVWCCPRGIGGGIPGFVGYSSPVPMGDITVAQASMLGQLGLFQLAIWGALGIGITVLVTQLVKRATGAVVSNPDSDVLFKFSVSPHSEGWSLIRVETPSGQTMGYVTRMDDGFAAQTIKGAVVGGKKKDPYEAAWALYANTRSVDTKDTLLGFGT